MNLNDLSVVVTGGTGGLGEVAVAAFLAAGATVTATHSPRSAPQSADFAARFGDGASRLHLIGVNLTDEASVAALAESVQEKTGKIDAWVNIVGGYAGGTSVADTSLEEFERMFTLNLRTAFLGSRAAMRAMLPRKTGRIINVSSKGGLRGSALHAGYAASKSAIIRLTETLAAEAAGHGITANVLLPGMIDTPANRAAMPDADRSGWVSPSDIAAVMVFLASPEARGVNGASIEV